eukprot:Sspe_Gene.52773::Locus_29220_Transcript_2_2_Confidence_0.667_Length_2241::g.52773::m.52773
MQDGSIITLTIPTGHEGYLHDIRAAKRLQGMLEQLAKDRPSDEEVLQWISDWAMWQVSLMKCTKASAECTERKLPRLSFNDFTGLDEVGHGLWGRLFRAKQASYIRTEGSTSASTFYLEEVLASASTKKYNRAAAERRVAEEVLDTLLVVDHPNLQHLLGTTSSALSYIVSVAPTYTPLRLFLGSLYNTGRNISVTQLVALLIDVSSAVAAMHATGEVHGFVGHRNVHLDNPDGTSYILWGNSGYLRFCVKCDELDMPPCPSTREEADQLMWKTIQAPECPSYYGMTKEADVWSIGVLAWQVVNREFFDQQLDDRGESLERLYHSLSHDGRAMFSSSPGCPKEVWDVVSQCFSRPEKRPTAQKLADELRAIEEIITVDGATQHFDTLAIPPPSDGLTFLQYNVPPLRRELTSLVASKEAIEFNLRAIAADIGEEGGIGRALEEIGKALQSASYCKSIRIVRPPLVMANTTAAAISRRHLSAPQDEDLDESLADLLKRAQSNGALSHFAVAHLPVGPSSVQALGLFVQVSQLTCLMGEHLNLETPSVGPALLRESLAPLSLTHVAFPHCNLDDEAASEVAAVLVTSGCVLEMLDLSHNCITQQGGVLLADALCYNTSITTLDLAYNKVTDVGAAAFGKSLMRNKVLRNLNLQCNQLTTKGASDILDVLEDRPHIAYYAVDGLVSFRYVAPQQSQSPPRITASADERICA